MSRKNNIAPEARKALNQFKIEMSSEIGLNTESKDGKNINTVVMDAYKDRMSYENYGDDYND
ncbi:small, acid-soluble spore protein, alpha/beta type [Sporosalibacterium faouarense]|uniref:small, acid-soluble spore protein, alpha/beta type n=1 Tax=Sporosalibacterium faouarense TaxID=516123 RepID=UPI00141D0F6F|nr:small, acid-soluble spore protein, alpha/beta type [Sporosalibacterium faouarense]MTI49834.1 small, acid-soluble spore protein, alpha/beta type [Bacillota bacterium]